jgi:hypothetical protein
MTFCYSRSSHPPAQDSEKLLRTDWYVSSRHGSSASRPSILKTAIRMLRQAQATHHYLEKEMFFQDSEVPLGRPRGLCLNRKRALTPQAAFLQHV